MSERSQPQFDEAFAAIARANRFDKLKPRRYPSAIMQAVQNGVYTAYGTVEYALEKLSAQPRYLKIGTAIAAVAMTASVWFIGTANDRSASMDTRIELPGTGGQIACQAVAKLAIENGLNPDDGENCSLAGKAADREIIEAYPESKGTGPVAVTITWSSTGTGRFSVDTEPIPNTAVR